MKTLLTIIALLTFCVTASAQTLPRWRADTHIRVEARGFTDKERERVNAAIEAWRPLLPGGLTIEIGTPGNVTIIRAAVEDVRELETCEFFAFNSLIDDVMIRIDPRAGSGEKFQRVVEHAIGHALGLSHRPKSVMAERDAASLRIAFWKIEGKTYHPDREDAARLREIYSAPTQTLRFNAPADMPTSGTGVVTSSAPEPETITTPNTGLARYSFHRRITRGTKWRESDFIWSDDKRLIEINVKGDKINVPRFPVGTNVNAEWWARLSRSWSVTWATGMSVVKDGDENLEFPVRAWGADGTYVEMSNYRLHRTSVRVTEVDQ